MTVTARTDIHRPSAPEFDPQAYEYGATFDFDPEFPDVNRYATSVRKNLHRNGYSHSGQWGQGRCDHCGTRLRYGSLMIHEATRSYIYVGEQCLDNRFELAAADFAVLRREARLGRERKAKAQRIAELTAAHPLIAELTYNQPGTTTDSDKFLFEVSEKFAKYGELSERQIAAVCKSIQRRMVWQAERDAKRIAEQAARPAAPAPSGRTVITGEILFAKWQDTSNGMTARARIYCEGGFTVWATVPAALTADERGIHMAADEFVGKRITMTVTLVPSDSDETFAFGNRPAKAEFLP